MTITFPISLPASPRERTIRITPRSVTAVAQSIYTLQQVVQVQAGQAWALDVDLPPMARPEAEPWVAALVSLNGAQGTFLMGPTIGATPLGIATGTPVVAGAGQTGATLDTGGWTASQTGILKAGDWLQLGSGSTTRLHKVLVDADSDASGLATFDIWPALRESPADASAIVVNTAQGIWRLATSGAPWDIDSAAHYGVSFKAMEAL